MSLPSGFGRPVSLGQYDVGGAWVTVDASKPSALGIGPGATAIQREITGMMIQVEPTKNDVELTFDGATVQLFKGSLEPKFIPCTSLYSNNLCKIRSAGVASTAHITVFERE